MDDGNDGMAPRSLQTAYRAATAVLLAAVAVPYVLRWQARPVGMVG